MNIGRKSLIAAAAALLCTVAQAQPATDPVAIDIPAQRMQDALNALAKQSGFQVVFAVPSVQGKTSPKIQGSYTPEDALKKLLSGTSLSYEFINDKIIAIRTSAEAGERASSVNAGPGILRLAQAGRTLSSETGEGPGEVEKDADTSPETSSQGTSDSTLEEIVVTGTHIRGAKDQFSPVTSVTRDDMDLAGYTDVSDVFDSLPQNFGGGVAPDTILAGDVRGAGSAGINLRGLGHEATLVLLNGRRLAPGGLSGEFVDISAIPASAVDRIEIVSDGASAIYGSDAIAGVVNIILRQDFTGAETRVGLSSLTDGDGDMLTAGQTVGWAGNRAHALLSYEYSSDDGLDANDKDFAVAAVDPTYLLPAGRKHSVFASAGADLSDRISITTDGYYNDRHNTAYYSDSQFGLSQFLAKSDVEQAGGAAGLNLKLPGEWHGDIDAAYSRSSFAQKSFYLIPPGIDGFTIDSHADILSFDASTGGPLFHLTDEAVRVVVGAHYRTESVDQSNFARITGGGTIVDVDLEKKRHVLAAYAELYAPLISKSNAVPGIERLALTIAARYDDYSDVGSSSDPKFGVVWTPFESLNLRGTYGTSFRVSRLSLLRDDFSAAIGVLADPESPTGESVALYVFGTRSDLDPEQAKTWTAGFDFSPHALENLRLRGTYFHIDYTDRIGTPSVILDEAFRFANWTGTVTRSPGAGVVQDFADTAEVLYNYADFFPSLGDLSLNDVTVILDERFQNLSSSKVSGFDVEVQYDVPSSVGDWSFTMNSTILTTFDQQVTPLTVVEDQLNTFGNPIDVKLRGSATWRIAPLAASLHVNYVDRYKDNEAVGNVVAVSSWTTVDASVRLDLEHIFGGGLSKKAFLSLSATNLFNKDPPEIGPRVAGTGTFFDAANADPSGRRVGLLMSKNW